MTAQDWLDAFDRYQIGYGQLDANIDNAATLIRELTAERTAEERELAAKSERSEELKEQGADQGSSTGRGV